MTTYLLLLTGVLSVLFPSSHSLSCIECKDTSDSCTGDAVQCPKSDQVCMSVYTVTSTGGVPISKMFMRECGDRASCHRSGSLSIPISQIQSSTTCCYSNRCTPDKPVLPPVSSEKNGISCKSCVSTTEESCQTSQYMQCTGSEVKCVAQSSTTKGPLVTIKSSLRGCASAGFCNVSHDEGSFGDLTITTDVTCSDRSSGLQYSLPLLLLTTGLILKIFF